MNNDELNRDSQYRIAALHAAVKRAGQDGGIAGDAVDVYVLANLNYQWLTGRTDLHDPLYEKSKKEKKDETVDNN